MALNFPSDPGTQTPVNTYSPDSTPLASDNGVTYVWDGEKWTATTSSNYLPLSGGTLTGNLTVPSLNGGPLSGLRNAIINGDMRQWNRGVPIASASVENRYTADRWYATVSAANMEVTRTRNGPTGFSFCMETNASVSNIQQGIELIGVGEAGQFAVGTTWTLSVWSTINLSGSTTFFNFRDEVGSPTNSVTAANPAAPAFASTGETSNGFTRYSATFSIAAEPASTNTNASILIRTNNTAGAQFTGIQLECGPVATPFEHRPIGTELALCQRYYQKLDASLRLPVPSMNTSQRIGTFIRVVPMRTAPTNETTTTAGTTFSSTADLIIASGTAATENSGFLVANYTADAEL